MYIVIIGCGRFGSTVAKELSKENHDVVVIDRDEENLKRLGTDGSFNGQRIRGVEFDTGVLMEAGIDNADIFLALTPDDNKNIMAVEIAKKIYGVKRVISRVSNLSMESIYKDLSIDIINPVNVSVDILKLRLFSNENLNVAVLDNDLTIEEIPVKTNSMGKVEDIESKYKCVVSAILRNDKFKIASKQEILQLGDKIICTINKKERDMLIASI